MAKQVVLADVLSRMEAQWQRMSVNNPARTALTDAAQILIQQQHQLEALREQHQAAERPIVTLE